MRKRLIFLAIALITLCSFSEKVSRGNAAHKANRKATHREVHIRKGSMTLHRIPGKDLTTGSGAEC